MERNEIPAKVASVQAKPNLADIQAPGAPSPGWQYADAFLPTAAPHIREFVALALDGTPDQKTGRRLVGMPLAVCPRCAFLMRPGLPCDVCANVGHVKDGLFLFSYDGGSDKRLADACAALSAERGDYADGLHELWLRSVTAAETLCLAAMHDTLQTLEARFSETANDGTEGGPA